MAMASARVESLKGPVKSLADVSVMIEDLVKTSESMEDKLGTRPVNRAAAVLTSVNEAARGGTIKVYHNLNNRPIRMAVTINLDAETVGRQIVKCNLADDNKTARYVKGDPQFDTGFGEQNKV